MLRPRAAAWMAMLVAVSASACDTLIGDVDVARQTRVEPAPILGVAGTGALPARPPLALPPPPPAVKPVADGGAAGPADAGADAQVGDLPDAAPPVPVLPRPVLVDPAATLALVGFEGGEPHLGACAQGFVIGVRPTANPNDADFGQRLTFIEPICGTAQNDATSGGLRVTRDDSILSWDTSGEFQGPPPTEVPDERLTWVPQPETFCPDSAPALVGLSGEIDPVAPDAADTVVIRSLVIECAPLVLAPNGVDVAADAAGHQLIFRADSFAADGAETYRSACEGGDVATQLLLHAGFWLDGFVLGCSSLRSPLPDGSACAEARECSSGVCSAEGACSP